MAWPVGTPLGLRLAASLLLGGSASAGAPMSSAVPEDWESPSRTPLSAGTAVGVAAGTVPEAMTGVAAAETVSPLGSDPPFVLLPVARPCVDPEPDVAAGAARAFGVGPVVNVAFDPLVGVGVLGSEGGWALPAGPELSLVVGPDTEAPPLVGGMFDV